jgi:DNA-binding transcriptional LysR family regulator
MRWEAPGRLGLEITLKARLRVSAVEGVRAFVLADAGLTIVSEWMFADCDRSLGGVPGGLLGDYKSSHFQRPSARGGVATVGRTQRGIPATMAGLKGREDE